MLTRDPTQQRAEPPGLAGLPEAGERRLSSDAALYATATYVAQVMIFIGGVVQKGLLGPQGTGYWTLMGTAWLAFSLTSLGVVHGAIRQIPHHRGRDDLNVATDTADTAFTFSQLTMSATGIALVVVALVLGSGWAPELRWGLALVGITAPLRNLVDCHEMVYQATKRFVPLSFGLIIKGSVTLLVQTALVLLLGFYGMFAGLVAVSFAALILYRRLGVSGRRSPAFHYRLNRRRLVELVQFGIPLYVFSQAWALFLAVDSLILATFVGVRELGYYALAVSVTSYIILMPRSIVQTVFPRMQERYSAAQDAKAIHRYARMTQIVLAFMLVPPLVGAAYFLLPVLIRHALPAFEPAIGVVHIMVAGSFLIALVELPIELMITIGRRWHLSLLMVAAVLLNVSANYIAVAVLNGGIEGAAYATVMSYLLLLLVVSAYGFGATGGWQTAVKLLGALATVVTWSLIWLWLIEFALGPGGGSLPHDLAINLAKLAIFCAALAPWLWMVQREYGAVSTLIMAGNGLLRRSARVCRELIRP